MWLRNDRRAHASESPGLAAGEPPEAPRKSVVIAGEGELWMWNEWSDPRESVESDSTPGGLAIRAEAEEEDWEEQAWSGDDDWDDDDDGDDDDSDDDWDDDDWDDLDDLDEELDDEDLDEEWEDVGEDEEDE